MSRSRKARLEPPRVTVQINGKDVNWGKGSRGTSVTVSLSCPREEDVPNTGLRAFFLAEKIQADREAARKRPSPGAKAPPSPGGGGASEGDEALAATKEQLQAIAALRYKLGDQRTEEPESKRQAADWIKDLNARVAKTRGKK